MSLPYKKNILSITGILKTQSCRKSTVLDSPFVKGAGGLVNQNRLLCTRPMYYLPYNKTLRDFSRYLRNNSTLSEVLLWNELKNGKMLGYQFNRQKPLHKYIVDFYCKKLNLVIEIDGYTHGFEEVYLNDIKREEILKSMGLNFLRFDDMEVKKDKYNVLRVIEDFIHKFEEGKIVP